MFFTVYFYIIIYKIVTLSAATVEYTDCFSAEG